MDKDRPDCPALGKYWRDENTCVEVDQCPCMDKTEKYIQPHMPFMGEWEVCQCIDNAYTCVPNKIVEPTKAPVTDVTPVANNITVIPITVTPPKHCDPEL